VVCPFRKERARPAGGLSNARGNNNQEVNSMKKYGIIFLAAITLLLVGDASAPAQTQDELPKFEIGAQFSSLSINKRFETQTEPGFGGRFTANLTDNFAVEVEGNIFPRDERFGFSGSGGRAIQGLAGIKIGKRYQRFGIFAKARPGLISFSRGKTELTLSNPSDPFSQLNIRSERLTHFALDLGGVLEFYPSRRIFTRLDFGDTIIRYGQTTSNVLVSTPGGGLTSMPLTAPADTRHNFQFSAGIGFRF
jgi:hypothetical protein